MLALADHLSVDILVFLKYGLPAEFEREALILHNHYLFSGCMCMCFFGGNILRSLAPVSALYGMCWHHRISSLINTLRFVAEGSIAEHAGNHTSPQDHF